MTTTPATVTQDNNELARALIEYVMTYHREQVKVTIVQTYEYDGKTRAIVKAVDGYPFSANDVSACGESHGAWNFNCFRGVLVDFLKPVQS